MELFPLRGNKQQVTGRKLKRTERSRTTTSFYETRAIAEFIY